MSSRNVQLITGDACKLPLEDNSVDLIVTHPPYFGIDVIRYGGNAKDQINVSNDIKKVLKLMVRAAQEMERVLKPTGSLIIANGPNNQMDSRILLAILENTKFNYIDKVIQTSYGFEAEGNDVRQEVIISEAITTWHHMSLSGPMYNNPFMVRKYNDPVWRLPTNNVLDPVDMKLGKKHHVLDTMNKAIPKRFVEMFSLPGDVVFDPFGGSALVAVTAAELGRVGISNDISEDQTKVARERIKLTFGEQ